VVCSSSEKRGLTEEEEDGLEAEPAAVDDVVLPLDGIQCDGVDILVED
jgi:hypothetical protein